MKKSPSAYLEDISQCIADIALYSKGMTRKDFYEKHMVQDAILLKVAVIGEIVKRLPLTLREQEKKIPWKAIAGMRDIVVHEYSEIDLVSVWKTIKKDLPTLNEAVQRLLKQFRV